MIAHEDRRDWLDLDIGLPRVDLDCTETKPWLQYGLNPARVSF